MSRDMHFLYKGEVHKQEEVQLWNQINDEICINTIVKYNFKIEKFVLHFLICRNNLDNLQACCRLFSKLEI